MARRAHPIGLLLIALLCSACTGGGTPPPAPTAAVPSVGPAQPQQITLESPLAGASVGSPIALRGRVAFYPFEGSLSYRVLDVSGSQIGAGAFQASGSYGQPATFAAQAVYTLPTDGQGRVEVFEVSEKDGSIRAIASVPVSLAASAGGPAPATQVPLTPGGPQPTAPFPTLAPLPTQPLPPEPTAVPPQIITIDTPAAEVSVGSPIVITGRTNRFPTGGTLRYRFTDTAGRQLGQGTFPVAGGASGPGQFTAQLNFNLPNGGGPIRLDLLDQETSGAVLATATISLYVEPPQVLYIDTPPPGQQVGSPVVITGRTARPPFQNNLGYIITGPDGEQLGAGLVPVDAGFRQPGTFNASVDFQLPIDGGTVRFALYDQNADSGETVASTALSLRVAPQPQQIAIESPAPGTQVGSPVVIAGRMVRFPNGGVLRYRFTQYGLVLGQGSFVVSGQLQGGATFNQSLNFDPPANGGPVRLDLFDQNGGTVVASAGLDMYVAEPAPPQPAPVQITITSPRGGAQVTIPFQVTGRVSGNPSGGVLYYNVYDDQGFILGSGSAPVFPAFGGARFSTSVNFRRPPASTVQLELYALDPATGQPIGQVRLALNVVTPRPA